MGTDAKIGEVFLVNKVSQHDMYLPFDGAHLDYAKKAIDLPLGEGDFNFPEGVTVSNHAHCLTGDQFLDQEEKIAQLKASYQAQVIEMEAFAVASVAREFDKKEKTLIIKAISDGANEEAKTAHMDNLDFAMEQSIKVLQHIIPQLR